jgi:hypothetical protein
MNVTPKDALRFLLEIAGIVSVGYWGFSATDHPVARLVLALGAPLLLIAVWAVAVAPAATNPIPQHLRFLLGTGLLLLAAFGLRAAGQPTAAAGFAVLVVVNTLLAFVLRRAS